MAGIGRGVGIVPQTPIIDIEKMKKQRADDTAARTSSNTAFLQPQFTYGKYLAQQAATNPMAIANLQGQQGREAIMKQALGGAVTGGALGALQASRGAVAANAQLSPQIANAGMRETATTQNNFQRYLDGQRSFANGLGQAASGATSNRDAEDANRRNRNNSLLGGVVQTGAGLASMFSDKNAKTDIKDGQASASSFLESIAAKQYGKKGVAGFSDYLASKKKGG